VDQVRAEIPVLSRRKGIGREVAWRVRRENVARRSGFIVVVWGDGGDFVGMIRPVKFLSILVSGTWTDL
jgi:hypothetical protein